MKTETRFEDVFQKQVDELFDAEKQILEALPKLMVRASCEELVEAFQQHLDQTKEHATRLEIICGRAGMEPGARKSEGMRGLLSEAESAAADLSKSPALDIVLITAARKVEHYEIAGYSAACALAETLALQDTFDLLQTTLQEESDTDEDLSDIAEAILSGDIAPDQAQVPVDEEEQTRG